MQKDFGFPYEIIKSKRKSCAIQIRSDGKVLVRVPLWMSHVKALDFLEQHLSWVERSREKCNQNKPTIMPLSKEELQSLKEKAKIIFPEKVEFYAKHMGVEYGKITIRCQKTRWGSCSLKGNLNFNFLLLLAPEEVLEYVVVHELCHRKQMNHSKAFWAEVEAVLPNYKTAYQWLKEHGAELFALGGILV